MAGEIREGKVVISTVVDGFSNPNEADDYVAEEDFDEFDEADDDDGKGGSKALTKKLEELKNQALERFDRCHAVREGAQDLRQGRLRHAGLREGAARLVGRADDHPLHRQDHREAVRHGARQVDDVRKKERELRRIIVDKCGTRRTTSSSRLPATRPATRRPNLLNLKWVEKQAAAGKPWSAGDGRNIPPVQDLQQS
jgi:RNA polymerase primary sigma factor